MSIPKRSPWVERMLLHHVIVVANLAMPIVLKPSAIPTALFLTMNAIRVLLDFSTCMHKVSSVQRAAWAHIPSSTHLYRRTIADSVRLTLFRSVVRQNAQSALIILRRPPVVAN